VIAALLALALAPGPQIGIRELLPEMSDMERLAYRPDPWYTCAQASSYDRNSKSPTEDWFANWDAGKYLRVETREGRKERVMAELKGPGAVVRIWSANPAGVLRFYFDGESNPRLMAQAGDLLSGKVKPFGDPFAYVSSAGWNLYYPLPYAKSLKITVDDTDGDKSAGMYYHVGYRTYGPSTIVRTYTQGEADSSARALTEIGKALLSPKNPEPNGSAMVVLANAGVAGFEIPGPALVDYFEVKVKGGSKDVAWDDPNHLRRVLRETQLRMTFDDELCVDVPLGDFFGTAAGLNAYQTLPLEVTSDGTMISRLPMPFGKKARVELVGRGRRNLAVDFRYRSKPKPFGNNAYYLRARFGRDFGGTRPMRDMMMLYARGEGVWLGSSLHVANPTPGWWGEGDEKVYVDGETFPSTFGTGTEDYYGYAWCSPQPFLRPYHSQPRCDGPGNFGHTLVNRFHVFDPIPFAKSLQFDMEMWHWEDVQSVWAYTSYWYAKPGSASNPSADPLTTPFPELPKPKPVEGALEGEDLNVVEMTGGERERQTGFWQTSKETQLWWKHMKAGDRLVVEFPVEKAGRYEIVAHLCGARDYGRHRLFLDGKEVGLFDFYNGSLVWNKHSLGVHDLAAGARRLTVVSEGSREGALPGGMFGLDYLLLVPVKDSR
jgi:hypothetical protein